MHSATANDHTPMAPLCFSVHPSVSRCSTMAHVSESAEDPPAGKGTAKMGAVGDPSTGADRHGEAEGTGHTWVGTVAGGCSLRSPAWWAPAQVQTNARGVLDDQSYGNSHLGEVLKINQCTNYSHHYYTDQFTVHTSLMISCLYPPRKLQGALRMQIYI